MPIYCPVCGDKNEHPSSVSTCESCDYTAGVAYWLWLPKDKFLKEWKRVYPDKPLPPWITEKEVTE